MASFLNTALSGLLANQRALATISHNIANVNTEGYNRQLVEFGARQPDLLGGQNYGNGVDVTSIKRQYDGFLTTQVRDTTSEHSRLQTFNEMASLSDELLADPQGGITPALQSFFSAVQDVADDPASTTARVALLNEAAGLGSRFEYIERRLSDQAKDVNARIGSAVTEINSLSQSIRETNLDILGARSVGRSAPPDLLDKRDALLQQLSEQVAVTTLENPDGTMNVFVGNGQTLVTNDTAFELTTLRNPADLTQLQVAYQGAAGTININSAISGGELGGVLDFRRDMLESARNSLGRVALGIAESFNQQHRQGIDLKGELGGDFFSVAGPEVTANDNNTGTASVSAAVEKLTEITNQDYELAYDGSNYTLRSLNGASSVTGTGPLSLDGFTVTIDSGAAVAGDRFIIRPARNAAASLSVAVTDSNRIAAGSPIVTSTALENSSDAVVSAGHVLEVTDPNLSNGVDIVFKDPTNYDLVDADGTVLSAGTLDYTTVGGDNIDFNGWRVTLAGAPQAGDRFSVAANSGGVADNRNALSLANLQNDGILDSGASNIQEAYSAVVGEVGAQTRQSEVNADVQSALLATAQSRREAVSGVNFEEEAAKLVQFQQAFQAGARVMATADTLFNALLNAV
jgi:flagellar hook-associated protein 1 FlgK